MLSKLKKLKKLERSLEIQIPGEMYEDRFSGKIKKLGQTLKMDGFRKGKVPFDVVEQRYGPSVHAEVLNELIQETYPNEISEHKLNPAINGFTKSLSDELPRKKIRVNSIAPGFIKSSYYNNFKKNKKLLYKWTLSRIPLGKWGENIDIADLTIFLLSENSKYINGQILKVDGGWTST